MKKTLQTLIAIALVCTSVNAQTIMGRTHASPSPSPSPTPPKVRKTIQPARLQVAKTEKVSLAPPKEDAPLIIAIYRGGGSFDQGNFDRALQAAAQQDAPPKVFLNNIEGTVTPVVEIPKPEILKEAPILPNAAIEKDVVMDPERISRDKLPSEKTEFPQSVVQPQQEEKAMNSVKAEARTPGVTPELLPPPSLEPLSPMRKN